MTVVELIALLMFWVLLFLVFQVYVLYPLELTLIPVGTRGSSSKGGGELPSVTLVVAAYNEESIIGEKVENSLALTYPLEKLDVVVFSDASEDATDDIVRSYDDVNLWRIEGRLGKTECQNRVVEHLDTDVIVFSDANSMYEPDAILNLVDEFHEGVGCVVGELRYSDGGVEGESFYWRYERLLKRLESRFNSLVTGNGAIYAVRRESYVPLSTDAISDFAEPLAIIRNGQSVKYAEDAIAVEQTGASLESELVRRVRIVRRSWSTLVANRDLLNPLQYPRFAFELSSHKAIRWLTPLFLPPLFICNLILVWTSGSLLYASLLVGQSTCYAFAFGGWLTTRTGRSPPTILHVPYYFLLSNYGMLLGLIAFLRDGTVVTWETASRGASEK